MTEVAATTTAANRLRWATGRTAEFVVGAVFLVFAVPKMLDVNVFIVAIGQYGVIDHPTLLATAAVVTLAIETALGVALVLGLSPRWLVLGLTALLLVKFSALIAYGWAFHDLTDCGCGGPIRMGPASSLLKNAALLALCGVAWWGVGRTPTGKGGAIKAALAAFLAVGVAGYAYGHVEPPPPPAAEVARPFAQFAFTDPETSVTWDLGQGEYLVAMLSATCEHCQAAVEDLNRLQLEGTVPLVVGLCEGTPEQLETFRALTQPEFPTHLLGTRVFYTFVNQAPPRFILVRDGAEVKAWDEKLPEPSEMAAARDGAEPAETSETLVNQGSTE